MGIYVDDPERLGPAWDEALAAKRPVVLEVQTDPEVPAARKYIITNGPAQGGKGAQKEALLAKIDAALAPRPVEELAAGDKEILEHYENQVRHDERKKLLNDYDRHGPRRWMISAL